MYFKTWREPLIEQKEKRDEKRDKLIEQLKDNQERIVQAIEYDPQKAPLRVKHYRNFIAGIHVANMHL